MKISFRVLLTIAVCISVSLSALPGVAAELTGSVRVTVTDAGTHKPLPFTRVSIYGPRSLTGLTGIDGTVTFEALPPGTYEIVVPYKNGYFSKSLRKVGVTSMPTANVPMPLQAQPRRPPSWLQTIARVSSKPKPKSSTTQTGSDSTEGKLSGSTVSALQTLPNVVLQGGGFAQYPSLGGHSPNQTAVTIEGVPVSAFGGTPNLQPFNLDLFSSVNISENSAYGAAGGTVNFDAPDPTLDWIANSSAIEGSFGNAGLALTEKGTSGRLGLVFAHAVRDQGNPLDGMRFLDSSGLDYVHRAIAHTTGDAFKARYPFSLNNILFASFITIRSDVPLFCTVFTGPTPCGYGPVNDQHNMLTSAQLRDSLTIGRLSLDVTAFHNRTSLNVDQSGRYVNGINLPQLSSNATLANGLILNGQLQIGRGYPVNFNLTTDNQTTATTGNAFGTIIPPALSNLSFTSVAVSGQLFTHRRLSSNLSLGMQRQGAQSRANAQLWFTYTPTIYDTFGLQYGTGFLAAPAAAFAGIADPASLQFNCAARNAVGFGPATPSNDSGTTKTTLSWNHTGRKISTTISLHHEADFNTSVLALVNSEALNPALFTPAYLAGVQQNFMASCGASAPLSTQNLYYQINATAPRAAYDGGEFSLHLDASRYFSADLSYGMMLARAYGNVGPLFSNGSTVISGRQLPNQPIHTANLSLAALIGNAGLTALANVHYVSANNPNNLPAYAVVDAGLQIPLKQGGTLTLSLLNLTNTFAGTFATNNGAVPLATQSGSFATIAAPLTPHSINVAWRMPFGYGAQLIDVPSYDAGPNAFGFRLSPYPNAPPADPFALDRRSGRCGPEALPGATKYLGVVRQYVARIEAARAQNGSYPVTFPEDDTQGMRLYYRRNASSFAVLISVDKNTSWDNKLAILKPLAGCARIYSGFLPETQRRHLYIPPYDEQQELVPFFDFAPEVGFYYPPSLIENQSLFPAYADVPASPPSDPFAISNASKCVSSVRTGASALVSVLQPYIVAYYDRHEKPVAPEGFTITPHVAKGGPWLEIRSPDIDVALLSQCLTIIGAPQATIYKMGLDGTNQPALDYSPRLGFYNAL
jgi:hypothetical protein